MFSNSSKYAINAVLFLSIYASEENKIGVKAVAEKLKIPASFLAKILQTLARKKVISSSKGPGGGFWLSDKEKEAPLMSVVENLDEKDKFEICFMGLRECSHTEPCPLHNATQPFKNELKKQINNNTIASFAEKIVNKESFLFV